ncbi:MAG: hypothetical protein AAF414_13490 [Pseudomonadota bacterium]
MASNQGGSSVSGFWLIIAAIVAAIGVIWSVLALTAVDTSVAEELGMEVDLAWPQIASIVALIAYAIIVILGLMRRAAIRTIGVLVGWIAVAAILIGYIFIGARVAAVGDGGEVLQEVSIVGSDAWVSLIISIVVAVVTTFAASRGRR